jgi:hypothetical protein
MKMRKMKRFAAITLLAAVMCLSTAQAFAGDIPSPPVAGPQETPGVTANGTQETPGLLTLIEILLDGVLISD